MVWNYDTTFEHAKERATKLTVRVKQLQRFLRTPHILKFTVMKVRRLIGSVFVGCLYGVKPGRKGQKPPTSIRILEGQYHKTLKVAFRIGHEKPVENTIAWTGMPTWEQVLARAMTV